MSALPIILCGKSPPLVNYVRKHLLPEYEGTPLPHALYLPTHHLTRPVIHTIYSTPAGILELPLLLKTPPTIPSGSGPNLGSQNYAKRPIAVVTGGGFDDEAFEAMRKACADVTADIPWGKPDVAKMREMPNYGNMDAFGGRIVERMKENLGKLGGGGEEGVFLY